LNRYTIHKIIVCTVFIIQITTVAFAQNQPEESNPKSDYITQVYIYLDPNMPVDLRKYAESFATDRIKEIRNLIYDRTVFMKKAYNTKTSNSGGILGNDTSKKGKIIILNVRYKEFIQRTVDKESKIEGEYLIRKNYLKSFNISSQLIDTRDSSVMYKYDKEMSYSKENYTNVFNELHKRIAVFYPDIKEPEKPKPAQRTIFIYYSASLLYAKPFGEYSGIVTHMCGIDTNCTIKGLWDFPVNPTASLSVLYGFSDNKRIKQYFGMPATLGINYDFPSFHNVDFSSSISAGYMFHYIIAETSRLYRDPIVSFQTIVSKNYSDSVKIRCTVGYNLFFEKSAKGSYLTISAGAERKFIR